MNNARTHYDLTHVFTFMFEGRLLRRSQRAIARLLFDPNRSPSRASSTPASSFAVRTNSSLQKPRDAELSTARVGSDSLGVTAQDLEAR